MVYERMKECNEQKVEHIIIHLLYGAHVEHVSPSTK